MYRQGHGLSPYVDAVRRDPFLSRIVAMLAVFALLAPLAWFVGRDSATVVRTKLPGAAVPAEAIGARPASSILASPSTASAASAGATPASTPASTTAPPPATAPQEPAVTTAATPVPTTAKPVPTTAKPAPPPTTAKPVPTTAKPVPTTAKPAPPPTTAKPAPPPSTAPPTTAPPTTVPAPAPPVATEYTREQSIAIIREVWPDDLEDKALAIAKRESNYLASVDNGWCCYGLFQIYFEANKKWLATQGVTNAEQLRDAWVNTRVAYALYQLAGWRPWGG